MNSAQLAANPTPSRSKDGMNPGDWVVWRHGQELGDKCSYWDNCSGEHVLVCIPDGTFWDSSWRASNCTMKEDRLHRCWVLHGEWPNVTVDKNGLTCGAGAGSIVGHGGWHGFLTNGKLDISR